MALSLTGCAASDVRNCFVQDTQLPDLGKAVRAPGVGETAIALATALRQGDIATARPLLTADPQLAKVRLGDGADMLSLAVSGCNIEAVRMLLKAGAPPDGQGEGLPLVLALRATDDEMARTLLAGGASPNPSGAPVRPLRTVIGLNMPDRLAMLIAAGADINKPARTGRQPLHIALDMERFRMVRQLLDAGADPWAIDSSGANLATGLTTPLLTGDAQEAKAQQALRTRLTALDWPEPAPNPRAIRALALEGKWPPVQAKDARPIPPAVLEMIQQRAR